MLHDSVDDFLKAFPEGDIIFINPLDFTHPEEIELVPCMEHGEKDHAGNLLPGVFRMVKRKEELKNEAT